MKILCTFSGKVGDILWSLPTVREIGMRYRGPIGARSSLYFGIMPQYELLLPLLNSQSYIDKAIIIRDWICTGSPWGDQPWEAPVPEGIFDKVFHLTYQRHPNANEALIDFIAAQQELRLTSPVVPFIECHPVVKEQEYVEEIVLDPFIAFAFNGMYQEEKKRFLDKLTDNFGKQQPKKLQFIDSSYFSFEQAAYMIKDAICFIGCRSSNYVIAHGVGQRNIFIYEPHPSRNMMGPLGHTFSNPHWIDCNSPLHSTPEQAADIAFNVTRQWLLEKEIYKN